MKKLFISASFLGLFLVFGNTIAAQASKTVVLEIDKETKAAVMTIKDDKSLADSDKEKYIQRIETFATSAKKNDDAKAKEVFETEYKRIAENYNRVTGNKLPKLIEEE